MKPVQLIITVIALLITLTACSKLSEEEYYKTAKVMYAKEKYAEAVENFKKLVEYYPEGAHSAEAMFMMGFINANDIKNMQDAEKYYNEFIAKYPKHELADDAQYELNNLGKDINELPMFQNIAADSAENKPAQE
jgi:TolA-binding protein